MNRYYSSLVAAMSGGGGGSSLPARTTAPTRVGGGGFYSSSGNFSVAVPGTDLTGDLVIAVQSATSTTTTAVLNASTNAGAVELDPKKSGPVPVSSVRINSRAMYFRTAGDAATHTASGGQANPVTNILLSEVWRNADDPILIDSGVFGTDVGWEQSGNDRIFPNFVVPTGYVFLCVVMSNSDYATGGIVWTGPTAAAAFQTASGFDGGTWSATAAAGTYTGSKFAAAVETDGQVGYIIAIPGTT